jgi:hypothetical protein
MPVYFLHLSNMATATPITIESSGNPTKIFIAFDLWKIIIENLYDENVGGEFGSILPYRLINKTFGDMILQCIGEVRITISRKTKINSTLKMKILNVLLSQPLSLQKLMITFKVKRSSNMWHDKKDSKIDHHMYNLICGCKELCSIQVYVANSDLMSSEGLQQIRNLKSYG